MQKLKRHTVLSVCLIIEFFIVELLNCLRPRVFSPDVKHKYRCDEQERHYQDWDWSTATNKDKVN